MVGSFFSSRQFPDDSYRPLIYIYEKPIVMALKRNKRPGLCYLALAVDIFPQVC
jgi:hypothetical protein